MRAQECDSSTELQENAPKRKHKGPADRSLDISQCEMPPASIGGGQQNSLSGGYQSPTIFLANSAAAFISDSSGFPLWIPLNSPLQWNSRSSIGMPTLSATAFTFL